MPGAPRRPLRIFPAARGAANTFRIMQVSVILTPEAGKAIHDRAAGRRSAPLAAGLSSIADLVRPVHAGVADERLLPFFFAEVPDAQAAESLIRTLTGSPHVTAAYVKPPEEAP